MALDEENKSSVERVRDALYRRDANSKTHARRKIHRESFDVTSNWEDDDLTALPQTPETESPEQVLDELHQGHVRDQDPLAEALHRTEVMQATQPAARRPGLGRRFLKTLFIASAVFFLIAGAIAVYILFFGGRQVACENITLSVRGPGTVPSGQEVSLNISVLNQNIVPLEGAELVIDYPEGARSTLNNTVSLPTQREQVGTIEPGETVRSTGRALLFGKEQTEYEIMTALEFSVKDSNGSWRCEEPYHVTLSTAPVSVAVKGLQEISSGQELALEVEVSSNSELMVPDVRLIAEYPYGFDFVSAEPKPDAGETVWDIGDVGPGTKRTITLRGVVTGYGSEGRKLLFSLGEASKVDESELNAVLQTVEHAFLMTSPFLSLTAKINEEEGPEHVVVPGDWIQGTLSWTNPEDEALHDVEIETTLPGVMFDKRSVQVGAGFFRSVDNTFLWTPQTYEPMRTLEPGAEGRVTFRFATVPFSELTNARNPTIEMAFDVRARRISDDTTVEQGLTAQEKHIIKFETEVDLDPYILYGIGPFTNAGPHPPKVDEETTYTVTWRLSNTTNDIEDGKVVAELPVNVSWLDMVAPSTEEVTFNPVTRKVIWNVGDLAAATGHQSAAREASFQVALIPSITQLRVPAVLVDDVTFSGVDAFTTTVVERAEGTLDTKLTRDPFFARDQGNVR